MESRFFASWLMSVVVAGCFLPGLASPKRAVPIREQLVSLQNETGLTMASFSRGPAILDFARRNSTGREILPAPAGRAQDGAISPHGTRIAFGWRYPQSFYEFRLGIAQRDGTDPREYPAIKNPDKFCWSPDESKLAVYSLERAGAARPSGKLYVLDLPSGKAQMITAAPALLTPQCWSPDGRSLVYYIQSGERTLGTMLLPLGTAVVCDLVRKTTVNLGSGVYPTWSPDGTWIAIYDQDGYYLIRPSGEERKLLFGVTRAATGLLWSPNLLFVAYGTCCRYTMFEGAGVRVHVRRLADGAEDWVAVVNYRMDDRNLNWVQPPQASPPMEQKAPNNLKPRRP